MKIGISTGCLYPMLTEKCVSELLKIGCDSLEIFFNTFSELESDYLDSLNFILKKYNAHITSIHPFTSGYESFLLFSNYERRFRDGVNIYEMYFRSAKHLGAKKVILHGLRSDFKTALDNKTYFDRFKILSERARSYGIELLQENVNLFRGNNIEFIRSMYEYIPESAKFVCDIKQANLADIAPIEMVKAMSCGLNHIHISDFTVNKRCVLPGKGSFDLKKFLYEVKKNGFDGDVIIEVYRSSFNEINELKDSYEYLKSLC